MDAQYARSSRVIRDRKMAIEVFRVIFFSHADTSDYVDHQAI